MPHGAIIGMTTSGKTTLAKEMAKAFRARGVETLVLRKPREVWPAASASWQTDDPERFLSAFWQSKSCACFMELSDGAVSKWDERFHKCFTEGRHEGHRCFYISQFASTVHPVIRGNCESLYLFTVDYDGAKKWSSSFCDVALLDAVKLPQFHFLMKANRYTPAVERNLTI